MSDYTKKSTDDYIPYRTQQPDKSFLYGRDAGFFLPLFQSLGTFAVSFLALTLLGWIWNWTYMLEIAVTASTILFALYWFVALFRWNLVSWLEQVTGLDLNGDNQIGKPKSTPVMKLRISDVTDGRFSQTDTELPAKPDKMIAFFRGALNGRGFANRTWAGAGKLFSDPQFRKIIDLLKARELIQYKDGNASNGFEWTDEGRTIADEVASGNVEVLYE